MPVTFKLIICVVCIRVGLGIFFFFFVLHFFLLSNLKRVYRRERVVNVYNVVVGFYRFIGTHLLDGVPARFAIRADRDDLLNCSEAHEITISRGNIRAGRNAVFAGRSRERTQ